jgi:hypothetical protein
MANDGFLDGYDSTYADAWSTDVVQDLILQVLEKDITPPLNEFYRGNQAAIVAFVCGINLRPLD